MENEEKKTAKITFMVTAPTLHSQLCIKRHFSIFDPEQRKRSYPVIITFWDTPTLYSYSVGAPPQ
jgi:hypothetical protein